MVRESRRWLKIRRHKKKQAKQIFVLTEFDASDPCNVTKMCDPICWRSESRKLLGIYGRLVRALCGWFWVQSEIFDIVELCHDFWRFLTFHDVLRRFVTFSDVLEPCYTQQKKIKVWFFELFSEIRVINIMDDKFPSKVLWRSLTFSEVFRRFPTRYILRLSSALLYIFCEISSVSRFLELFFENQKNFCWEIAFYGWKL